MSPNNDLTNNTCLVEDIAAYVDGELDLERELELEIHFSNCERCSKELNQQKQFLCGLDVGLGQEREIELPEDFTERVVVTAESTVSGLRRPSERSNAVFICAGLLLFVLVAMGTGVGHFFDGLSILFEKVAIVGGFFGHAVYAVFIGVAIIVRSLASQVWTDQILGVTFMAGLSIVVFVVSFRVLRIRI